MPSERLDFAIVEDFIARRHPDPDHIRAAGLEGRCAGVEHAAKVAAPWIASLLDVDRRRVLTWRQRGVSYFDADLIACRLGLHPASLWPNWWALEPSKRERDDRDYWRVLRAQALEESRRLRIAARAS